MLQGIVSLNSHGHSALVAAACAMYLMQQDDKAREIQRDFEQAVSCFFRGEVDKAERLFTKFAAQYPSDHVAAQYTERCHHWHTDVAQKVERHMEELGNLLRDPNRQDVARIAYEKSHKELMTDL